MRVQSIPADTDQESWNVLVRSWRAMTLADRVALIEQLNSDVETIAIAGIRMRHPDATDREVLHELARRRFGSELADAAFDSTDRPT